MTTPDQSKGDRSHDEVLAGEYVVGVLDAQGRRAVEERMRRDRNFAAIVHRWEENLSGFEREFAPEAPPHGLYAQIEARIHGPEDREAVMRAGVLAFVWHSVAFWRAVAFSGIFGVAIMGISQFTSTNTPVRPPMVAQMVAKDNAISLMAHFDNASGRLRVTPVASGEQAEKSLQLWLIEGDGQPRSLGVLPQTGEGEIEVPDDMRQQFAAGVVLAVSLEPYGGSTTGKPTGPVLAAGEARF